MTAAPAAAGDTTPALGPGQSGHDRVRRARDGAWRTASACRGVPSCERAPSAGPGANADGVLRHPAG